MQISALALPPVRVALLCAAGLVATGCAAGDDADVGIGPTVTAYDAYGVPFGSAGPTVDRPGRYLIPTQAEVPTISSPEQGIDFAVRTLLDEGASSDRFATYWSGPCAPGLQPVEVTIRSAVVTIRLAGVAPHSESCGLSAAQRAVRGQQIAWTVRTYLDPRWEQAPPVVRVVEGDGSTWSAVADPAFIAPSARRQH